MVIILCLGVSFAQGTVVIDEYEALTSDEEMDLTQRIESINETDAFEVVIVITDQMNGKSSMAYADDFYDENGYGLDDRNSGILMLINMDDREVWLSTTGMGIEVFTDSRIDVMTDRIAEYLSDGDYFESCEVFLEDVQTYLDRGIPAGQVTVESSYDATDSMSYLEKVGMLVTTPWVYLAALAVSVLATLGLSINSKGRDTTHFQTYESAGSFDLRRSEDTYIRESISKTPIPKQNSNNTSTTHRGSSGTSHGGGGKKF